MDYPLRFLSRMLSDNQEQEECSTRELVGVCVCVCPMLSFHTPSVQFIQTKAIMMWNIQNTKEKWRTYNTPHSTESYPAVNDSCFGVTFTRINSRRILDTHFNIHSEVTNSFGRGITSQQWIMPNKVSTAAKMFLW